MESKVYSAGSIVTSLHQESLMPDDIQAWIVLTIFLSGVLANVYLSLYTSEKNCKSSRGIRVMIHNQICANLLGLFAHAFLPTHDERLRESGTRLDYLCKIMPSLGFLGVAVSLSNLACICVVYYYGKKGRAGPSRRSACLIVVNLWLVAILLTAPLTIALDSLEITFNNTSAKMCAVVWQTRHHEEVYMDYIFVFKFLLPLFVMFTICLKIELLRARSSRMLPNFLSLPAVLVDVFAVTCLLFLAYFYPLHEVASDESSLGVKDFGATKAFNIIRVLELIGLANCSIVPVVLKSCVDEYCVVCKNGEKDYLAVSSDDESGFPVIMPSPNVGYVTYDVIAEDVIADKSPRSIQTKDVKILIFSS